MIQIMVPMWIHRMCNFFPYPPFIFVYKNKKEIQHHCKEQRKDNIRNEQNEKNKFS